MKKIISLHEEDGLTSYYQNLYDASQGSSSPPTERAKHFLLSVERQSVVTIFPNFSTQATLQITRINEVNQTIAIKLLKQLQESVSEKSPKLVEDKVTVEKILLKALDLIRIQFNLLDQEEIPGFLRSYLTNNQLQLIETMISI
jgi:hypothetical protein